jgi:hypothetical protein
VALDLGIDEDDQDHLEERRDDLGEARPLGAVAVEAGAREQQNHHERGERRVLLGRAIGVRQGVGVLDRGLEGKRGPDREEQAADVERRQDRDAAERPDRVEAEDPAQEQRLGRADVAVGEGEGLDLPQLFDKAVRHFGGAVSGGSNPRPRPM